LYGFMDDIKCQSGFEEDDRRGVGKGLVYKGVPFMDVIAQTDIQFYNNWRVYSKCYSNMRFAGWTEMDHNRNLRKICSVFTPSGQYDEGAYIKVTKSTGTIEKTPLPPYEDDVTVVADVAWAKKIELCYTDRNGVEHGVSLPYLLGTGVDTFTRGGKLIKFPAIWRPSNWDSLR